MIKAVVQQDFETNNNNFKNVERNSSMFTNPVNSELHSLEKQLTQLLNQDNMDSDLKITLYQDMLNKSLELFNHSKKITNVISKPVIKQPYEITHTDFKPALKNIKKIKKMPVKRKISELGYKTKK